MVADRLLAEVAQAVVLEVEVAGQEAAQVGLDRGLVLRGRRDDLGLEDRAVLVEPIAVPAQPARRLGPAAAGAGARLDLDGGRVGLLVGGDDPQRLVERVEDLDAADDDAAERVAADRAEPGLGRRLARQRRQLLRVQRVARERPAQVGAALAQPRVQRGRVLDVQLLEVLLVLARARCRGRRSTRAGRPRAGSGPASRARRTRARARSRAPRSRPSSAPSRARARARARAPRRARAARAGAARGRSRRRGR